MEKLNLNSNTMRSIKGIYENGQLTLDEPILTNQPVEVMVMFNDMQPEKEPKKPLMFNARPLGVQPGETFRREDIYETDMR
jgi:hypothetical protein